MSGELSYVTIHPCKTGYYLLTEKKAMRLPAVDKKYYRILQNRCKFMNTYVNVSSQLFNQVQMYGM